MSAQLNNVEFVEFLIAQQLKLLHTAIPGYVVAFDPKTQMAQVQIGVQKVSIVEGEEVTSNPAVLIECKVSFSGGAAWIVEHQVDPGDEGMIIFSQRCIEGWLNTGGVGENPIRRFHDRNDCTFIPGVRSNPNTISNFDNDGIKLRNKDNSKYVWLKDAGIEIKGNLSVDGNIGSSGTVTGDTDVVGGGVSVKGHTHGPGTYSNSGGAVGGESDPPS